MEVWKNHPALPFNLFVSNFGRVKREASTYCTFFFGKCLYRKMKEKILGGTKLSTKGYRRINTGREIFFIGRLVAQVFVENPLNKPQVNHKNGIKTDDRAENLEWVTNQENRDHAVANGLHPTGSKISKRLKESDIPDIKLSCKNGEKQSVVASEYGVCQQTISHIVNGETWKHVKE